MKLKKIMNLAMILLFLSLAAGVGVFVYGSQQTYKLREGFTSVPLQYDPDASSSTYSTGDMEIKVYGGFVKGLEKKAGGAQSIVIRALSPLPSIEVSNTAGKPVSLILENINPDFYTQSIQGIKLTVSKIQVNTIQFQVPVTAGETRRIEPVRPDAADTTGKYRYVILGDNRDGYDTFSKIIAQSNGQNPVFVIDNGDLVFSGKPNQYRLFDNTVSSISTTLCTALGNHDIRADGRAIYTMLYGPPYYSFDFADSHFIFLDSSPGWAEPRAISDEQYAWLERDLIKSQGKKIFVISHIPPRDPRSGVTKNEIPNYVNEVKSGDSWAEQKLDSYLETKSMAHGFQDPQEAERFEKLMSTYKVDTVYSSHIHSYYEYYKDGVRYLITGGAGAELLTENSYYHYFIANFAQPSSTIMVELPSPVNNYIPRYAATVNLFAKALYQENPTAVILILTGFVLLMLLLILKIILWKKALLVSLGKWIGDTWKYSAKRFRDFVPKKKK